MFVSKTQYIKELKEKDTVSSPFLVKYAATVTDKNGKPYMNVVLMDKSGELEARIWEDVPRYSGQVIRDNFIHVEGKVQGYQGRKQVVINRVRLLREDEVEVKEFVPEGTLDAEALYQQLMGYVDSMKDPHYQALAYSILRDDADIVDRVKRAPAAKSVHHAYPTGLLEHVVSITGILDSLSKHYGKYLDRDLLFLGGFFHDIGKIWELSYDRVTDYTNEGKLIGHLVMGVELVERKIQEINRAGKYRPNGSSEEKALSPFPEEKRLLVKHLILAHHGQYEYGSPKRPKCLEALIVHYIDDLDSKVNAIRCFIENDQNPGEWTLLNKMYERYFFKPDWARQQPSQEN